MEATITGLRIDRTAGPIKRALARVFGIGTDKAMKPFAYLWIANKQKLEDLPRRRLQHVADAWFGHGLAWFKCMIEALSWQHLCKAGQAEHQACRPVVPARWRHAQLKMPTVCDMEPRCVKLSLRKKSSSNSKSLHNISTVSYTHLTLPTNREV